MPKPKANIWLEETNLSLLQGWARDGLTDKQIANKAQICERTLNNWKKKYPAVKEALATGKEVADYEVEKSLYQRAIGYTKVLFEEKLDKDGCVHTLKKEVHYPPDTLAQIFWLKNRKPEVWREKVQLDQNSNEENKKVVIINDLPKQ